MHSNNDSFGARLQNKRNGVSKQAFQQRPRQASSHSGKNDLHQLMNIDMPNSRLSDDTISRISDMVYRELRASESASLSPESKSVRLSKPNAVSPSPSEQDLIIKQEPGSEPEQNTPRRVSLEGSYPTSTSFQPQSLAPEPASTLPGKPCPSAGPSQPPTHRPKPRQPLRCVESRVFIINPIVSPLKTPPFTVSSFTKLTPSPSSAFPSFGEKVIGKLKTLTGGPSSPCTFANSSTKINQFEQPMQQLKNATRADASISSFVAPPSPPLSHSPAGSGIAPQPPIKQDYSKIINSLSRKLSQSEFATLPYLEFSELMALYEYYECLHRDIVPACSAAARALRVYKTLWTSQEELTGCKPPSSLEYLDESIVLHWASNYLTTVVSATAAPANAAAKPGPPPEPKPKPKVTLPPIGSQQHLSPTEYDVAAQVMSWLEKEHRNIDVFCRVIAFVKHRNGIKLGAREIAKQSADLDAPAPRLPLSISACLELLKVIKKELKQKSRT